MTGRDVRLERVNASLSAKERGLLVLRSWKEDTEEDPSWRWSMPPEQVDEFNRLIALMNGVNRWLGLLIFDLKEKVEQLSLRSGMLSMAVLWQWQAFELGEFIVGCTKEPITESEYKEKEREARAEYLPVEQLAYVLTERHDGFTEEDRDPDAHDDAIVLPEAWERVQAEKAKEIAALVASGTLSGKGRGKKLTVEAGSFYDWLGEPVPVYPPWAEAYEVVPDSEGERVSLHRFRREDAHKAYRRGPTRLVVHLPEVADQFEREGESHVNEVVAGLKEALREGVIAVWQQAEAVERVVAEIAAEFGGEDPAIPDVRHTLDHCRERLRDLHGEAQRYVPAFELPEPSEEDLATVRRLAEREL